MYFGFIGFFCLVLTGWLLTRRIRVLLYGVLTTGNVVGHETDEMDGTLSHFPVVTFVDALGEKHRFRSVAGSSAKSPKPMVGTEVNVRYLPSNPELVYMTGFLHMWAAPIALFLLGSAGLLLWWYP
jgi:hypothetical protein